MLASKCAILVTSNEPFGPSVRTVGVSSAPLFFGSLRASDRGFTPSSSPVRVPGVSFFPFVSGTVRVCTTFRAVLLSSLALGYVTSVCAVKCVSSDSLLYRSTTTSAALSIVLSVVTKSASVPCDSSVSS